MPARTRSSTSGRRREAALQVQHGHHGPGEVRRCAVALEFGAQQLEAGAHAGGSRHRPRRRPRRRCGTRSPGRLRRSPARPGLPGQQLRLGDGLVERLQVPARCLRRSVPCHRSSRPWPSMTASSQAHLAAIEHDRLPGRHGALRRIEADAGLPVASIATSQSWSGWRWRVRAVQRKTAAGADSADPGQLAGAQPRAAQVRAVRALVDDQQVPAHVLADHVPGPVRRAAPSADPAGPRAGPGCSTRRRRARPRRAPSGVSIGPGLAGR